MPMNNGHYVAPTWVNEGPPALDADELNSISGTLENLDLSQGDIATPYVKMGLTGIPTIGASLGVLADIGNVHVWRKTVTTEEGIPEVPAGYELGEVETNIYISTGTTTNRVTIAESDSVKVSNDGVVTLVNPTSHTETVTDWGYSQHYDQLKGKYCKVNTDNATSNGASVFFLPSDILLRSDQSGLYTTKYQKVVGSPYVPAVPPGTHVTYLTSTNRNAYQEGDDAKEAGYVLGASESIICASGVAGNSFRVSYAQSVEVSDDGIVSLSGGSTSDWYTNFESFAGFCNSNVREKFCKFVGLNNNGTVYESIVYVTNTATFSSTEESSKLSLLLDEAQVVTGYPAIPAGTTIEYLGVLGEGVKVQTGSYIGTGTYGPNNPSSLTFEFSPKILLLSSGDSRPILFIADFFGRTNIVITGQLNLEQKSITAKGKTISWWNNASYTGYSADTVQMNSNGSLYEYIAFG